MTTLPYKGHVFTLTQSAPGVSPSGLDLTCGPHWLLRISLDYVPTTPIHHWLDRAIELIQLLNLDTFC